MNDLDKEFIKNMQTQVCVSITTAANHLYTAQRAIRELTNECQDPDWSESGEATAAMSLLAQAIDLTWAIRTIAETIAERNNAYQ